MMKSHRKIRNMIIFAMLGAVLFASKVVFEALPNIHPVTMLIMVYTVVYRSRALIPIYIFVLISGVYYGFQIWWIPYVYIWAINWAITMILPQKMSKKTAMIVYPIVCGILGVLYGTFYAPAQALLFSYDFATMLKWIVAGLPFDLMHGFGNFVMGFLIYPISKVLMRLERAGKA